MFRRLRASAREKMKAEIQNATRERRANPKQIGPLSRPIPKPMPDPLAPESIAVVENKKVKKMQATAIIEGRDSVVVWKKGGGDWR